MPIRSRIFITKAGSDLEVSIEAGNHKELLKLLRRLGQCIELPGVESARDKVIAGALGRRVCKDRSLNLRKVSRMHIVSNVGDQAVSAHHDFLHAWTAKIEEPPLETHLFVYLLILINFERRGL